MGYCDSDWAWDSEDRESTNRICQPHRRYIFHMEFKKATTCHTLNLWSEYVVATSCFCHAILLENLMKELNIPKEGPAWIYIDNKSAIALAKNPVFHDRSKRHTKSQDQVVYVFTTHPNFSTFSKLQAFLGVTNQV